MYSIGRYDIVGRMRIIFLNAWHGKLKQALSSYLRQEAPGTDIFCFQEAYDDMQQLCAEILPEYTAYTDEKSLSDTNTFKQAIYVRKGVKVVSSSSILKERLQTGLGLYLEIEREGKRLFVCNFHGISRPVDKLDNADRIVQSSTLIEFFKDKDYVIIGGDFNAFPETKSIKMFRARGYVDLIDAYHITNTRNRYVWERYPESKQYYSDYVFLSPTVRCINFAVPDNEMSDHLPLELDIAV